MIVAVTGGRDGVAEALVDRTLTTIDEAMGISVLVHGDARGVDTQCAQWARDRGISVRPYPADWRKHGRGAGPIRNKLMLTDSQCELLVVFPGGKGTAQGTAHCCNTAKTLGIRTWEVN
jgi:hypothetical protein